MVERVTPLSTDSTLNALGTIRSRPRQRVPEFLEQETTELTEDKS